MYHLRNMHLADHSWTTLLLDDPVRPEISASDRMHEHAEVLISINEQDEPVAVLCVRYCSQVPATVDEMLSDPGGPVAVFYSIWSYFPGAGSRMIIQARSRIESSRPGVNRFVTLSPQTEMARNFHIKNGAIVFRSNPCTVNYEYQ